MRKRAPPAHEVQRQRQTLFSGNRAVGINFSDQNDLVVKRAGCGDITHADDYANISAEMPLFLVRNIDLCNYSALTPVQKHAIPLAIGGLDILCSAQTGSGKTAAFLVPAVHKIGAVQGDDGGFDEENGVAAPRAVVLAPTRELATQINFEARKLCFDSPIRTVVLYGGAPVVPQLDQLARGADVVVATPGRLTDFLERGVITMEHTRFLVLDEADRMLDMGFEPQVRRIVQQSQMPESSEGRQTLLFSATLPPKMRQLAADFTAKEVATVSIGVVGAASQNIDQRILLVENARVRRLVVLLLAVCQL
jgi:ATP-dependent RNA helicase DDX3X